MSVFRTRRRLTLTIGVLLSVCVFGIVYIVLRSDASRALGRLSAGMTFEEVDAALNAKDCGGVNFANSKSHVWEFPDGSAANVEFGNGLVTRFESRKPPIYWRIRYLIRDYVGI